MKKLSLGVFYFLGIGVITGLLFAEPPGGQGGQAGPSDSSSSQPSSNSGTSGTSGTSGSSGMTGMPASPGMGAPPGAPSMPGTSGLSQGAIPAKPNAQGFFYVYENKGSRDNHFVPSGWMGDYGDIKINDADHTNPHSSPADIKITYNAKGAQGAGWAGIFWQQPANNWGTKPGGYDLSNFKKLTFWARGAKGGETVAEFKVGGITGEMGDSDSASLGPVVLTSNWKQYTIDLSGKDLKHIIGGFAWSASRDNNPDGFTIYLDDIRYQR